MLTKAEKIAIFCYFLFHFFFMEEKWLMISSQNLKAIIYNLNVIEYMFRIILGGHRFIMAAIKNKVPPWEIQWISSEFFYENLIFRLEIVC